MPTSGTLRHNKDWISELRSQAEELIRRLDTLAEATTEGRHDTGPAKAAEGDVLAVLEHMRLWRGGKDLDHQAVPATPRG